MRTATVVVLSLVAALAAAAAVPNTEIDKDFLVKQQKILRLLYHVQQPTIIPEEKEIAKTYKPIDHVDDYKDKEAVEVFWNYYTRLGFLPRKEVFSVYYEKHLKQVKGLFDLLFYAKDFESFYKTAVWAREYLNEGMFVYAFTVAVLHREDTRGVTLPAPYEIYPQLFVNADVIQKAYDYRLQGHVSKKDDAYIIYANYSYFPFASNKEELVTYFTEDVGLSSHFAYLQYKFPFWMNPTNYSITEFLYRGEMFFFTLQQLLARYYLERLSNHLPDVKPICYKDPVPVGYYPNLRLQNGREAPARPEGLYPHDIDFLYLDEVENYERRIRDAIDNGFAVGRDYHEYNLRESYMTYILGNIIEGNAESVNVDFYGSLYRNLFSLFGHIVDPKHKYDIPPSILELPETQLRDPLFYRIAKRILSIFYQYKNHLKPYTRHELGFPGVEIEDIVFEKLVTYFDNFDFEINNAVSLPNPDEGSKVNFVARQQRLNHKPFIYQLKVKSDKEVNAVVRVFIGPKYDVYGRELSLEERKEHYILLDMFPETLGVGENGIKRSSRDFFLYKQDAPHFSDLYQMTESALKDEKEFPQDLFRPYLRFPQHLMLPRGTRDGLPLSVFVIVSPIEVSLGQKAPYNVLDLPIFPIDRPIVDFEFDVPNVRFDETYVVFRRQQDTSTTA